MNDATVGLAVEQTTSGPAPHGMPMILPAGWVPVPVEPTREMLDHVHRVVPDTFSLGDEYRAMLEAAPKLESVDKSPILQEPLVDKSVDLQDRLLKALARAEAAAICLRKLLNECEEEMSPELQVHIQSSMKTAGDFLAASPRVLHGNGWLPIESAPKDGTWIALWRTPESAESCIQSEPFIIARWFDEYEEFSWPGEPYDVFTPWGRSIADAFIEDGNPFGTNDFTHWMPLPQPPMEPA